MNLQHLSRSFTDIFIKRPVFASTLSLLILLVGLMSFSHLNIRQYPKFTSPVINIDTSYTGASAELMEGFVTTPIENAISSVEGIDSIFSTSNQNESSVTVRLKLDYDVNKAFTDISSKVSSARSKLPKDIDNPIVSKNDRDEQVMWIQFQSSTLSPEVVTDYLIRVIQPQLQGVSGVSNADVVGGRFYAMRIFLDPMLMNAHQVTASDVKTALQTHNVQAAPGQLKSALQVFDIDAKTDLSTANQFNHLSIRNDNGRLVRIQDVGNANLGPENEDFSVFLNNTKTIFIGVYPKSDANPLDISKDIHKLLPTLQKNLPKGVEASIAVDFTKYISESLTEVQRTIIEACICVFLVIFIMIGSFRSVFVPLVTIPLSIIGAFMIMLAFNFSINTITLLAIVLAIGLVVDDAIVVLENIHRHLASGLSPMEAALSGAKEIAFPVIAMTLTLVAVYIPIGFMGQITGKLFTEFAFTLAGSVFISGFIALTLSPMMCSKLYHANHDLEAGFAGKVNRFFDRLMQRYKKVLNKILDYRWIIIAIAILVYISCYFLYNITPKELAPQEDQSVIYTPVFGPAAANLEYTEEYTKRIGMIYEKVPEKMLYGIVNGYPSGVNSGFAFLKLVPPNERKRSAQKIAAELMGPIFSIPGIDAYAITPSPLPGSGGGNSPIKLNLQTTGSYDSLSQATQKLITEINKWGALSHVDYTTLKIDKPQTVMAINRNLAADLGISMNDIADTLNLYLSKPIVTRFSIEGRSYNVLPQIYDQYRRTPTALNNLNLRTQSGELVPLSTVVDIQEKTVPRSLSHFQQLRSSTIEAALKPGGVTLGDAIEHLQKLVKETLPSEIQLDYGGQARQYVQNSGKMGQTFIFALLFIYLILAAQFESFRNPLIVMLSVPLSLAGGLLLLHLFGGSLNIYSQIGLITLVGLITKNGILIVEFANQQLENGMDIRNAVIEGASLRLRPILMTTCAMILGTMPLVFATGAGSVSRSQLGLVIVGGMSFGTLLTLFVIPVAYYLFANKKRKL